MKQTAFWRGKNGEYIPCLKYSAPIIRLLWVHRDQSMKTEKPTRCNNYMFIINFCLNMLRASLCPSSGEQRPSYCIWCIVLVVLDVVDSGCGGCVVGCEHCSHPTTQRPTTATNHIQHRTVTFTLLTSYNAAPHNRNQPHPAEPEQYTKCINWAFVLLKMGIVMPETCWDRS